MIGLRLALYISAALFLLACNEAPTDVDGTLIPGTDTLYTITSDSVPLLESVTTIAARKGMLNGTYVLFGKTTNSDAMVFVQISTFPTFPAADDYAVVSAELEMLPMPYLFGDTTNKTLSFTGYELQKRFPLDVTWDSVFNGGTTSYFSASDPQVCTFEREITDPADTLVRVPIDNATMKRWLVQMQDTTDRLNMLGIALVPKNMTSIRQFRNLTGATQLMQYRVITKHRDSTNNDTTYLQNVLANIVNTPDVATGDLVTQGARVFKIETKLDLRSIPKNALVIAASLQYTMDPVASQVGSTGADPVLALMYTTVTGTESFYATTLSGNDYLFPNIGYSVQQAMKKGDSTLTLTLTPTGATELWQMNRQVFHNMSAEPGKRPRLSVIYTVPRILQ